MAHTIRPSFHAEGLESRVLFDNTLPTAVGLGTVYGQVIKWGSVASNDTLDHYKFTLASTGKVFARLNNLSANADLRLIRDANNNGVAEASEVLAISANAGTANEQIIKAPLAPGLYYLQVKRVAGAPNYKLTVKTDYAGQNFNDARNIPAFTGTKTFKDYVDLEDQSDMYKITLSTFRSATIKLSGTGDAHLELARDFDNDGIYDVGQDFIHRSNGPNSTEQITWGLNAGTHYIRVFRGSADALFTLSITLT